MVLKFSFSLIEENEPIHIHAVYSGKNSKFWIIPEIKLADNKDMNSKELKKLESILKDNKEKIVEAWNEFESRKNELSIYDFVATEVQVLDNQLVVTLEDNRKIIVPLEYYPPLAFADVASVQGFEIMPGGYGIEWEALNYHLSVKGIVLGNKDNV